MTNKLPKPRLLFIHSEVRTYRVPIFNLIAEHYPTTFIFMSGGARNDELSLPHWRYINLKSSKFSPYQTDVSWSLPRLLWRKKNDYDIIIASGMFSFSTHASFLVAKLLKKKFILWDETWLLPKNWQTYTIVWYLKYIVRSADACIAAGTKAKELYLKLGARTDKIFIAPNCALDLAGHLIDQQKLQSLRTEINPDHKVVIGFLGRIVAYKNLDCLIHTFAQLEQEQTNVLLLIAGSGPDEQICQDLLQSLQVRNVYWVGRKHDDQVEPVPFEDMIYYFHLIDIFVLPGKFIRHDNVPAEAWGLTLNEAMSLGKPVIASDSVAAAFDLIVNQKTGLMVKNGDSKDLYRALATLVKQPTKRALMGKQAKKLIKQNYNFQNMFEGFKNAIESVEN